MMISVPAKVAFLAMPRAGSTSVERALEPICDIQFRENPRVKHMNYRRYNNHMGRYLKAMKIDGVITTALFREPIEWLGSWYRYRSRPDALGTPNSTAGKSFDEFVAAYLMDEPPQFAKVGQQSDFVKGPETDCGIDYLFRFDRLIDLQRFLSERLSADLSFVPKNESPVMDLPLSPALDTAIRARFATDYRIYNEVAL